jgi:hypothetical protein
LKAASVVEVLIMNKKEICEQLEKSLRSLYPDTLLEGHQLGFAEIDFFLEQCVVTTKPDGESSKQRVIALISAEWARFAQNFNYKVSADWFRWNEMMRQARVKLGHLPEPQVEVEAKKLVKQVLIQRYGKEAYDAARDTGAFLVENADWSQIDALAKSICDKLKIQPDQLTIVMVAGLQNNIPSPQVQGLCSHGHELRFCLVDKVEQTIERYFYEKEITQSAQIPLRQNPNEPKLSLREILRAKPVVVGHEKSFPGRLKV